MIREIALRADEMMARYSVLGMSTRNRLGRIRIRRPLGPRFFVGDDAKNVVPRLLCSLAKSD